MDIRFIEAFRVATNNVLSMMAQITPNFAEPVMRDSRKAFGEVTGIIGMTASGFNGNLMLSFDKECVLGVVEGLVGERYPKITSEVVDAVGEITNMVCGGAKAILSEQGLVFDMATPTIVVGQGIEISQSKGQRAISLLGTTSHGQFVIESSFLVR
jgi:chemotaxis protein CheX